MVEITETVIDSKRIYEGRVINVRVDTVKLPNGKISTRDIVEHNGAIAAVPLLPNGDVVLVRQFRLAAGGPLLEIPAGSINSGEEIEECVTRELEEEIHYQPGKVRHLCSIFVAPGYSSEKIHIYLAQDLTPKVAQGDDDEFIQLVVVPLDDALAMIDSGEIHDAKSVSGLLYAARLKSSGLL
jgi:ADP-ribose pyrophosphatase